MIIRTVVLATLLLAHMASAQETPPLLHVTVDASGLHIENATTTDYSTDQLFVFHEQADQRATTGLDDVALPSGEVVDIDLASFDAHFAEHPRTAAPRLVGFTLRDANGDTSFLLYRRNDDSSYQLDTRGSETVTEAMRDIPGYGVR
ncbi:MAG TPA: hypothetical protein PK916_11970 [Bacteroidota bacterium]|nr:hypothetical protein [Bacteroidota bacterium]